MRNKKQTIYCYSEKERAEAARHLAVSGGRRQSVEMTRFKGLGEISPSEFKQFIGKDMRLRQVSIDRLSEIPKVLNFYMGKNTPERKEYIMNNLI